MMHLPCDKDNPRRLMSESTPPGSHLVAILTDSKIVGRRLRCAHGRRSDRADGGQTTDRAGPRSNFPARLLRLQTEKIGSGRGWGHATAVLEIRLGARV